MWVTEHGDCLVAEGGSPPLPQKEAKIESEIRQGNGGHQSQDPQRTALFPEPHQPWYPPEILAPPSLWMSVRESPLSELRSTKLKLNNTAATISPLQCDGQGVVRES
jgi:hypothetical protein